MVLDLAEVEAWLGHSEPSPVPTVAPQVVAPLVAGMVPAGPPRPMRSMRQRDPAVVKVELAKKALAAERARRDLEAEKGLATLGLDKRIRRCRSLDDVALLAQEVAALVASGELSLERASGIKSMLAEVRQSRVGHLKHHPPKSAVREIQGGEARRKAAIAGQYETRLAEMQGALIQREVVVEAYAAQVAMVQAAFEGLPDRLAGLTAERIGEELDAVLMGFAGGLEVPEVPCG